MNTQICQLVMQRYWFLDMAHIDSIYRLDDIPLHHYGEYHLQHCRNVLTHVSSISAKHKIYNRKCSWL